MGAKLMIPSFILKVKESLPDAMIEGIVVNLPELLMVTEPFVGV